MYPLMNLCAPTPPDKATGIDSFRGYDYIVLSLMSDAYASKIDDPINSCFYFYIVSVDNQVDGVLSAISSGEIEREAIVRIINAMGTAQLVLLTVPEIPVDIKWYQNSCLLASAINKEIEKLAKEYPDKITICDTRPYIFSPDQLIDFHITHVEMRFVLPIIQLLQKILNYSSMLDDENVKIEKYRENEKNTFEKWVRTIAELDLLPKHLKSIGVKRLLWITNDVSRYSFLARNWKETSIKSFREALAADNSMYDIIVREDGLTRDLYKHQYAMNEFLQWRDKTLYLNDLVSSVISHAVYLPLIKKKLAGRPIINVFIPVSSYSGAKEDTMRFYDALLFRRGKSVAHLESFDYAGISSPTLRVSVVGDINLMTVSLPLLKTLPVMLRTNLGQINIDMRYSIVGESIDESVMGAIQKDDDAIVVITVARGSSSDRYLNTYRIQEMPGTIHAGRIFQKYQHVAGERDGLSFYEDNQLLNELGNNLLCNEISSRLLDTLNQSRPR
jgi:hypothetical protein